MGYPVIIWYLKLAEQVILTPHVKDILTAADGEGQQCRAAPACTASIERETNGSLEISALTKIMFLKQKCTQSGISFQMQQTLYISERSLKRRTQVIENETFTMVYNCSSNLRVMYSLGKFSSCLMNS